MSWFSSGWQPRTMRLFYHPCPWWGEKENGKKKAKLVGRDKDSLTEQRGNRTLTVITPTKRIHETREYTG